MLRILDGPAGRQTFLVRRAPRFVRVVASGLESDTPKWDVLDLLDDEVVAGETAFAYEIVAGTWAFVCVRPGGRYEYGHYRLVESQPAPEVLADTARWQAWAREQAEA